MRILQVSAHDGRPACGVYDHAARLTEQLGRQGHQAQLVLPADADARGWDLVHLHYVPFLYSGWGLGVLPLVNRLRRTAPLVLTVHEPRIRYRPSPRGLGLALAQDLVLQAICASARGIVVPTAAWLPFLRGRRAAVIPAGSVLPLDAAPAGAGEGVVGLIASGHPGRMHELAVAACRAAGARHGMAVIGLGEDRGDGLRYTGYLEPSAFAQRLAACDLLVLPFLDGVSGRRTSFISALQVGVGTLTTLTTPMRDFTVDGAFAHVRPAQHREFVAAAVAIAGDSPALQTLRNRSLELYRRELAWDVLAGRVLEVYRSSLR